MPLTKEKIGEFIDAAVKDQFKAKELLRLYPALKDARWLHNETVMHFLAIEGYTDAVRFLCEQGFDVNVVDEFGDPPLIHVAKLGHSEIARILLEHGADPNATSETDDNALHIAVGMGYTELADMLLKAGARADYVTDTGETVFDVLPYKPHKRKAMLEVLERHGVNSPSE